MTVTPEKLSSIAAFAAANLGKLNAPSKTTAIKSLAEVVRVLKGNMVSIEIAEWIAEALGSELDAETAQCEPVSVKGRDPLGYFPNLALTHAEVMTIKNSIFELWSDPQTCGDEFGLLPDRKLAPGKSAKSAGKMELAGVTGNATLTQSLAIVAQYTRQNDVSLHVSHGTVAVKHGSRALGLLATDMTPILSTADMPDKKLKAADLTAESNRAKLLWQLERYTHLTRAVQKSVAGKWADLIFNAGVSTDPVKCAALCKQFPAASVSDLKAALIARGITDAGIMKLVDKKI